jgi:hypothetical protein
MLELGLNRTEPRRRQMHHRVLKRRHQMNAEPEQFRLIRLHKTWADEFTLLWLFFVLLLFGGMYAVLEET